MEIEINGIIWRVIFCSPYDLHLKRKDGTFTIGACDDSNNTIYISKILGRSFMKQIIGHEVTHAVLSSYDIKLSEIKEELVSELISRFGKEIIYLTETIIGGVN